MHFRGNFPDFLLYYQEIITYKMAKVQNFHVLQKVVTLKIEFVIEIVLLVDVMCLKRQFHFFVSEILFSLKI
jgi:hypothetical protein